MAQHLLYSDSFSAQKLVLGPILNVQRVVAIRAQYYYESFMYLGSSWEFIVFACQFFNPLLELYNVLYN